jgi:hypothetical protein
MVSKNIVLYNLEGFIAYHISGLTACENRRLFKYTAFPVKRRCGYFM